MVWVKREYVHFLFSPVVFFHPFFYFSPIFFFQEGTEGHTLGSQAWQQVSRNHFMSVKDQAWVCNLIAARRDRLQLALEATQVRHIGLK